MVAMFTVKGSTKVSFAPLITFSLVGSVIALHLKLRTLKEKAVWVLSNIKTELPLNISDTTVFILLHFF